MSTNIYGAIALTGAAGALDAIDGTALADKDVAMVAVQGGMIYHYILDADSGVAESSPAVIAPDDNGGDKRWIFHACYVNEVAADAAAKAALTAAAGKIVYQTDETVFYGCISV